MTKLSRVRALVCVPLLALVVSAPALPATSAPTAATEATLSVSPAVYVGGQLVTLRGNIGRDGVRRVKLQGSMGRPGDSWQRLAATRTDAAGNFSFSMPAPSMFGIQRRVVSGGLRTPVVELEARSQDLVLREVGDPVAGPVPFRIRVDTVPDADSEVCPLRNRPDLPPPVLPNRDLTLQRRVGTEWQDVPGGTARTDEQGQATFWVVALEPGEVVYRVRQEDYTQGGNEIGWFPSFPTYIHVADPLAPDDSSGAEPSCPPHNRPPRSSGGNRTAGVPATTASQRLGWAPSLWDFGWEHGESLTSPPQRGTDRHGWWLDSSNGYGRASRHNGGLMLDSKRDNANGPGDRGSTWVTLRDNPRAYGRWETRIRLRSYETSDPDYRARIELVPDRESQYDCGGRTITIADLAAHSSRMRFGVTAAKASRQWSRSKWVGDVENEALAVAVEVSRRHISWFLNGRTIGTVRSRAAVPDVPMTLRLTLRGQGDREMNRTKAIFDWMRGFSLQHGDRTTDGHRLRVRRYRGGC